MRRIGNGIIPLGLLSAIFAIATLAAPKTLPAQDSAPSAYLQLKAQTAQNWSDGETGVVLLQGGVTIELERTTLSADRAVVWLRPTPGSVLDGQQVEIALLGNARLTQPQIERSGDRLYVTAQVRGSIRITSDQRIARRGEDSADYQAALAIRPVTATSGRDYELPSGTLLQRTWITPAPQDGPTSQPATRPFRPRSPVSVRARNTEQTMTADGKIALVLSGGVFLIQRSKDDNYIELSADKAVVFTTLKNIGDADALGAVSGVADAVEGAYLEGDVQINQTVTDRKGGEQRLKAEKVYYDFTNDRAILTQAVLHSIGPTIPVPLVMRAQTIRQLSVNEYTADKAELSTSGFAVPSYSVKAERAYVRQTPTEDVPPLTRTTFRASDATMRMFGQPFFYLPNIGGSLTEKTIPIRNLQFGSSRGFGPGVRTEWGLFESLGKPPPEDLDLSYRVDFSGDRGFALGLDGSYRGGDTGDFGKSFGTDLSNFDGKFTSYLALNDGKEDNLGRRRLRVDPGDEQRYRFYWEHQQFLPDGWQAQLRAGYASDPTFLEEYFQNEFDNGQGQDASAYLKRQQDTEALTFLLQYNPSGIITNANSLQEQATIERLPEIGYYRVGDAFGNRDQFTFFSANTASALRFDRSSADLQEQGFQVGQSPGLPSYGQTGLDDDRTYRADLRQEIDYPIAVGQFKVVPYVMGRYTPYSASAEGGAQNRLTSGAGLRGTTAFWRVDDSYESKLFDIHRLRHVIEPEVHLFTSASSVDSSDLFIYDEPIDAANDISAVQLALHQRWQTKRGGPGRWRSVDFFTVNVEANMYANQPDETFIQPNDFRGLFFPSLPEASLARNSINADALWRVSDSTAVLADMQYNTDESRIATASVGMSVQRDTRLSYFIGARYIEPLDSTIASVAGNYELSTKYSLAFVQSFNLGQRRNETSRLTVLRKFDRFTLTVSTYYDATEDVSGFSFGLIPEGFGTAVTSDSFASAFGR